MTQFELSVLIIARRDHVREGLHSLLAASPKIRAVYVADDCGLALGMLAEHQPAVVLFGPNQPIEDMLRLLDRIGRDGLAASCVAFVDDADQERRVKAAGAAAVVRTGFPAAQLAGLVEELLPV